MHACNCFDLLALCDIFPSNAGSAKRQKESLAARAGQESNDVTTDWEGGISMFPQFPDFPRTALFDLLSKGQFTTPNPNVFLMCIKSLTSLFEHTVLIWKDTRLTRSLSDIRDWPVI